MSSQSTMCANTNIDSTNSIDKRTLSLKFKPATKGRPIELFSNQITHLEKLKQILAKSPFVLDLSMMGTGKTYTSSRLYQTELFQNLLVIAPTSVKPKWAQISKDYDIPNVEFLGYCELRGVQLKQPKHGLLLRRDCVAEVARVQGDTHREQKCEFHATQKFHEMVKNGT